MGIKPNAYVNHQRVLITGNGTFSVTRPERLAKSWVHITVPKSMDLKGGSIAIDWVGFYGHERTIGTTNGNYESVRHDGAWCRFDFVASGIGGGYTSQYVYVAAYNEGDEINMSEAQV